MRAAKALVAALGTVVTALSAAFADDVFDGNDTAAVVSTVVLAIFTVVGVYQTRNAPEETSTVDLPREHRTY